MLDSLDTCDHPAPVGTDRALGLPLRRHDGLREHLEYAPETAWSVPVPGAGVAA